MQFEVFIVPAGGGKAMVELNRFLSSHRVIGVEKHLVTAQGGRTGLGFLCGVFAEGGHGRADGGRCGGSGEGGLS
jgi:hypothetical protein